MNAVGVEVEGPATPCNLAAVPLDGSHAVSVVVAGSDAEVPLAEHGVAVTRNDEVARCPQALGQGVDEPAGDDHLTTIADGAGTTSPLTPLPARPSLPIGALQASGPTCTLRSNGYETRRPSCWSSPHPRPSTHLRHVQSRCGVPWAGHHFDDRISATSVRCLTLEGRSLALQEDLWSRFL